MIADKKHDLIVTMAGIGGQYPPESWSTSAGMYNSKILTFEYIKIDFKR